MRAYPFYIAILGALVVGCTQQPPPKLAEAPQVLAAVAAAQRRPLELNEAQRSAVIDLLAVAGGSAHRFADPGLERPVYASFWKSPFDQQVDANRLLLVRYAEDGTFVYVGFARDGKLFTDGGGSLYGDPPWAQ